MNDDPLDVVSLLREYVARQSELCAALAERFPLSGDPLLLSLPQSGNLSLGDAFWEFQKHGRGVRFIQMPDGQVIDVPLLDHPKAVDAWRLVEHFESCGAERLRYLERSYPAIDARALMDLLQQLRNDGLLRAVLGKKGLYEIASPAGSVQR